MSSLSRILVQSKSEQRRGSPTYPIGYKAFIDELLV